MAGIRSSHLEVVCEKGDLRIFAKIHMKTSICKFPKACNFIKKGAQAQVVFPVNFVKFLITLFFITPSVDSSGLTLCRSIVPQKQLTFIGISTLQIGRVYAKSGRVYAQRTIHNNMDDIE